MEENDVKRKCDSRKWLAIILAVACVAFGIAVIVLAVEVIEKRENEEPPKSPQTFAQRLEYKIKTTWDNKPVEHVYMTIVLSATTANDLNIHVEGHFFNDPHNPGGTPGHSFHGLWKSEVAELFFLNDHNDYLQVELCPHGQHYVLMLRGVRNVVKDQLQVNYTINITGNKWQGDVIIPSNYLPTKITKFNAYTVHGSDSNRIHESLYPATAENYSTPDFHDLFYFQPIDLRGILPRNYNDQYESLEWQRIVETHPRYLIKTTWDDRPIDHEPIQLVLSAGDGNGLKIHVEGPFYNDPANPGGDKGKPFPGLWEYEVAEAFFLNDKYDYLEVELSPHGQHLILALRGERNMARDMLSITYTAGIQGERWYGDAIIPWDYLPSNVTKFNAYAIHGSNVSRVYESLYPVPHGQYAAADFHKLEYFNDIDLTKIVPAIYNHSYSSTLWKNIGETHPRYMISTTWNNKSINHEPIQLVLSSEEDDGLKIHVEGPFFDDPPNPGGEVGKPFPGLWDYEVAEAFFLNDLNDYLEVELSPHGQHLLLALRGERNMAKDMLNITYKAKVRRNRWIGDAIIPWSYLPSNVTKFNGYAIHGSDESRVYESLYPVPDGKYTDPDFHKLEYFQLIDLRQLVPHIYNKSYSSKLWNNIDETHPRYMISTTWDNQSIDHEPIQLVLSSGENDGLKIHVEGPFFDDPPNPGGEVGKPFPGLWQSEVAEAFFLNDLNDYLQVELCPHGQHFLLALRGERNMVKNMLNITFGTKIRENRWIGDATIPWIYFPSNVTKFNAYAVHGSNESRVYESLYPVPSGRYTDADFHKLEYFRSIDLRKIVSNIYSNSHISSFWKNIDESYPRYLITTTWDSRPIRHNEPMQVVLSSKDGNDLNIHVDGHFFNEPSNPGGEVGKPFSNLSYYEVTEAFFANDTGEYLQVTLSPHGQQLVILFQGINDTVKEMLNITYTTRIRGERWQGDALIPGNYLPYNITTFNAYTVHGNTSNREYESLYPMPGGTFPGPIFRYNLTYFKPIDLKFILPKNYNELHYSGMWT